MDHDLDPDGKRLPIRYDATSNGEHLPIEPSLQQRRANEEAHRLADEHGRKLGMGRRRFLVSSMGAASVLAACNRAHPGAGGHFNLTREATLDADAADATLSGDEFIFDVQMHCVDPSGDWAQGAEGELWARVLNQAFAQSVKCEDGYDCYSAHAMAKEIFLDSDTSAGVVSALWGTEGSNPTPIEYAAEAARVVEALDGDSHRCLIHGGVLANEPGEIEAMEMKAQHGAAAWKLYPQYGVSAPGYRLDDPDGPAPRLFDEARRLGVTTFALHKGISLFGQDPALSSPIDMGAAARDNPDLTFLIYHSGWQPGMPEGAFNEASPSGVDRLIMAHREAGFARNEGNLYAEMGSVWRGLMGRPDEAAHYLGKLLKQFGEERIIWGTDSIWYGSPQDQIVSFRSFQISEQMQEEHGYPALDAAAKRRIFGLNAAEVYGLDVAALSQGRFDERKAAYREAGGNPAFRGYGPATRRDFLALHAKTGGHPG